MINPEHQISKSQISAGVFKPITELARGELKAYKKGTLAEAAARRKGKPVAPLGTIQRPGVAAGRKIWPGSESPMGREIYRSGDYRKRKRLTGQVGSSMPNGRGGGHLQMNISLGHKEYEHTLNHELAHLAPRRNPVTFQQRMEDPVRRGREEGRADFMAVGKPTPGGYPGSRRFKRGYNQTQRKMDAAR